MFSCLLVALTITAQAEQVTDSDLATGYIVDDLFIYMHTGPGNNYRIAGSINAGEEIKLTGRTENNFSQIIDNKERQTWVESKYVTTTAGLRVIIGELNSKLATNETDHQQTLNNLEQANSEISQLNNNITDLNSKIATLEQQLTQTKSQLSNQDLDIKKEYFFNGAMVLGIGLLFGLIIPRISVRKKSSMDNWK